MGSALQEFMHSLRAGPVRRVVRLWGAGRRWRPEVEGFHQDAIAMSPWLSLLCGVLVLVAAAYLLYVVLRPESF